MLNPISLARKSRRVIAIVFIWAFAFSSLSAQGVKKKVRFPKGTSSITIRDAVVRGDRDRYYVGAKAGQRMSVKITSTEKNAVFQIYFHGEEESLPGAGMVMTRQAGRENCPSTTNTSSWLAAREGTPTTL
jgi:hypothetical protein